MHILRTSLIICAALLSFDALCKSPTQSDWKWVAGQTSPSGWHMQEGTAEVRIAKGKVTARLLDPNMPGGVSQLLEGQIDQGTVRVIRKTMCSDVDDEQLTGTYGKSTMNDYTFESIIVSNKWGFVAITRTLKRDNLTPRSETDRPQAAGR